MAAATIVIDDHIKKQNNKLEDRIDDIEKRINGIEDFVGLDETALKVHKELKMEQEMDEITRNSFNKQAGRNVK
ncbi:MAG: hypothetical protein PHW53_03780 [Patescibacteria group bacterium]|nr:hypothetical protein [Patescibacteria group bacterium]